MIYFRQGSPARHFGHLPFAATLKKKGQSALSAVCGRQIATQARVAPLREVIATGRRGPIRWSRTVKPVQLPQKYFPWRPLEAFPLTSKSWGWSHKVLLVCCTSGNVFQDVSPPHLRATRCRHLTRSLLGPRPPLAQHRPPRRWCIPWERSTVNAASRLGCCVAGSDFQDILPPHSYPHSRATQCRHLQ